MKKRMLCLLLALAVVISLVPLTVFASYEDFHKPNDGEPTDDVPYLDKAGDTQYADNVTPITSYGVRDEGWYILEGEQRIEGLIFTGETHLILADNATINLWNILLDGKAASIVIYAQSTGSAMGKLTADNKDCDYMAGIGSGYQVGCGDITIIGGDVTAIGGPLAAGIGSGWDSSCGDITINKNATHITAKGGKNAQDIGSGYEGKCGIISYIGNDNVRATVLSAGNVWIIVAVAGIAVIAIVALVMTKKKKTGN